MSEFLLRSENSISISSDTFMHVKKGSFVPTRALTDKAISKDNLMATYFYQLVTRPSIRLAYHCKL